WFMIQRGQWDAFLIGTETYYNENQKNPVPHDITGGWYEQDIRQLPARGIMQGEGNGKYFPERLLTRAEFATLLTR
ncbi:S-layer homology domain-containing protein, partial [Bacillus cereus]|uniref:S-layer homology domain-containing protein n=1 Tax=Bacillus cereus TaxID=1396 RepID=UPI00283BEDCB